MQVPWELICNMLLYAPAHCLTLISTLSISLRPHMSFSPSVVSQLCDSYAYTHYTHISTCQTCAVFSVAAWFILIRQNSSEIVFKALERSDSHSLRNYTLMALFVLCSAAFTFYIYHKIFMHLWMFYLTNVDISNGKGRSRGGGSEERLVILHFFCSWCVYYCKYCSKCWM